MNIIFNGDYFFRNMSHANINRNIVLALSRLGHNVAVKNVEDSDNYDSNNPDHKEIHKLVENPLKDSDYNIYKVHSLPLLKEKKKFNCVLYSDGAYTLYRGRRDELESYPITHLWLPTPDTANKINKELSFPVVGLGVDTGIDPKIFNPDVEPVDFGTTKFKFIIACDGTNSTPSRPFGGFRGTDVALKAFAEEFKSSENVCLIVKVGRPKGWEKQFLEAIKHKYLNSADIFLDASFTDDPASYWAGADCMLHPIRDGRWEACGLEALACGIPLIATKCGGPKMWGKFGVSFISYKEVPGDRLLDSHQSNDAVGKDIWREPSLDEFKKVMRKVFENKKEFKEKGIQGAQYVLERWKWSDIAERIVEFFNS